MGRWWPSWLAPRHSVGVAAWVVALQLEAFAVVLAAVRGGPVLLGVTTGAVVLTVAMTLLPWRSRTLWRRLVLRVAFLRRRRRERSFARTPVALRALDGALLDEVGGVGENRVGVLLRNNWWTSVSTIAPSGPGRLDGADRMLSPAALWSALSAAAAAAASLRVLVHRTTGLEGATRWRTWICLELDAATLGDAIAGRGGGRDGMTRTLITETSRMRIEAVHIGVHLEPLDAAGIAVAAHESLGVPTAPGTEIPALTEHWGGCSVAGLTHRTYQQSSRSSSDHLTSVLAAGVLPSATSLTLSASVQHGTDGLPRLRAFLRVAAAPEAWGAASAELADHSSQGGGGWTPLNGLHLPGMFATVPLGSTR